MAEKAASPQRPIIRLQEDTISRLRGSVVLPDSLSIVKALIENSIDASSTAIGILFIFSYVSLFLYLFYFLSKQSYF